MLPAIILRIEFTTVERRNADLSAENASLRYQVADAINRANNSGGGDGGCTIL